MWHRVCAMTVVAMVAVSLSASAAERVRVNLTYARKEAAAAASCPDEATFRALVAARLGYDPFEPGGTLALLVELRPQGSEMVGRLSLTGERGEKRGERTLRSGDTDCFELASSMALAAAVALDPDAVRTRVEVAAPPPSPTPPPPPASPPAPERHAPAPPDRRDAVPRSRSAIGLRLDAGAVLPVGIVPAPRGGVRGGAALDGGAWSIGVEGAYLFQSSRAESFGEVSASVAYGSLVPCGHPRLREGLALDLCVVGSAGAMFSDATHVNRSRPATDLFTTVAPRVGITVMPSAIVGFAAAFDAPVALSRVHLVIDDGGQRREVWAESPVGFLGGLSLVLRLR